MVQKKKKSSSDVAKVESDKAAASPPRGRGRPRAFEPDEALSKAVDVFRDGGFAATSLDDLSDAMGINRPSLYGTFGDKRELYLKAYERYRREMNEKFLPVFAPDLTLRAMLKKLYSTALDIYLSGDNGPRGCLTTMTASSEAMADPEIRTVVQNALKSTEQTLAKRFEVALKAGELPAGSDPAVVAQLVAATINSLAIRARAGLPRSELEVLANGTIDLVCAR
ncbi:MAG: TetR/AcrR family transcriptional regulator [Afipia sp.]|nr:TetR/AcrR family transcriptional regulator [Afipia sp.]